MAPLSKGNAEHVECLPGRVLGMSNIEPDGREAAGDRTLDVAFLVVDEHAGLRRELEGIAHGAIGGGGLQDVGMRGVDDALECPSSGRLRRNSAP